MSQPATGLASDHEVAICGPTHTGWCKYCQALKQIEVSVSEERETCAQWAESLPDFQADNDWQEGFNTACRMLASMIRARNDHASPEKLARSFARLTRSIAAARGAKRRIDATPDDRTDNCSPSEPSLFSSIETHVR